jgi:hypothetical protein
MTKRSNGGKGRGRTVAAVLALMIVAVAVPVLLSPVLFSSSAPYSPTWARSSAKGGSSAPANPRLNVPRTKAMDQACRQPSAAGCQHAVVEAIDHARAVEHVGPLTLPADYDSLSWPAQIRLLTDLERVARGLPGFTALSGKLDVRTEAAAASKSDPIGPKNTTWGSNWAGGEASALFADYDWMYNDGPGSPNLDCTASKASGCWDHRQNILGNYGPHPVIGASVTTVHGVKSMTELLSSAPVSPRS